MEEDCRIDDLGEKWVAWKCANSKPRTCCRMVKNDTNDNREHQPRTKHKLCWTCASGRHSQTHKLNTGSGTPNIRQCQGVVCLFQRLHRVHISRTSLMLLLLFLLLPHGLLAQSFDMPPTDFYEQPAGGQPEQLSNDKVLVCHADGIPQPVYRWKKDGRFMGERNSTSTSLKVEDLDRSDAGEYQCVASNAYGALLSNTAYVRVAYMVPFANSINQEKTVDQGQARIINMPPIDSYPEPQFQWLEGNDKIIHKEGLRHHITLKHQLVILETRLLTDDTKMFKARASNAHTGQTSDSQVFVLRVQNVGDASGDIPPRIVVPPSHTSVVNGADSVVMECVVNARPINHLAINWYRRSENNMRQTLEDSNKYVTSIYRRRLTILLPNLSDTGTYECEATFGKPEGATYPPASAQANLTVYERPKFTMLQKQELPADVGDLVTLPCKATGTPSPSHTWFRNAEALDLAARPRMSLLEDGSLEITSVQTSDSGVFQCLIKNAAGEMYTATWLRVHSSPPEIIQKPVNQSVIAESRAEFKCEVDGAPSPTISWYRVTATGGVEELTAQNERIQLVGNGGTELLIPMTQTSDTGRYVCNATNTLGSVVAEAYLTVTLKTKIVQPPQDVSVIKGSTTVLECGVVHDPLTTVTWVWYHNDAQIPGNDFRRQLTASGSLRIEQVRNEDIGTYRCQVTSAGGNAIAEAKVKVIELPYAPSITEAIISPDSDRAVVVKWRPGFDGGSPIKYFIVQKRLLPQDVQLLPHEGWTVVEGQVSKDATEFTIDGLQPARTYQFRVSAVNSVGEGQGSLASAPVKLPQQPPSGPPRGVVGSPRSESSIILQWQAPEDSQWNGPLLGYMIRYQPSGYPDDTIQHKNISSVLVNMYELTDLIIFQEYKIAIAAYNAEGTGVYSRNVLVRTQEGVPKAPPSDVSVEAISSTGIRITWMPPNSQFLNGINLGYKLEATAENSAEPPVEITIPSDTSNMLGQQTGYLTDLKKFTTYGITVLCFTSKGDGPKSAPKSVKTMEDVPGPVGSLLFDNILDTSLQVLWKPPSDVNGMLIGYTLTYMKKNFTVSKMSKALSASTLNYTITGLEATTTYTIEVFASTRIGPGPVTSAEISSGIPPEIPGRPTRLALSNTGETTIKLQFVPGFDGHTSISMWLVEAQTKQQSEDDQTWTLVYQTPHADPTSHGLVITVQNLYPYTFYRLRLMAENIAGRSQVSEPSSWFQTIQAAPTSTPDEVTVRAVNETALRVLWTPLASELWHGEQKGYLIRYRISGQPTFDNEVTIDSENTNSYTLVKLEEWTTYEVQMAAYNKIGRGPFSAIASDTTRESVPSAGPGNVTGEALSSTSIQVEWHEVPEWDQNGFILGYKVRYWSVEQSLEPMVRDIESATVMSAQLTELRKYVTYEIQVLAYTRIGDGALSESPVVVKTFEDVPGPPSSIYFPEVTHSTALLRWSPPREPNGAITGYKVEFKEKTDPPSQHSLSTDSLGPNRREYQALELQRSKYYVFTVTAKTQLGWGEPAEVEVYTILNRRVPEPPSQPEIGPSQIEARWVTINWQPGNKTYTPIRNYTIRVQEADGPFVPLPSYVPHDVTSFVVTNLKPNTKYRFSIAAYNDVGRSQFSGSSAQVTTREAAPDSPPLELHVVPQTKTAVLVSWKPPPRNTWNSREVEYDVQYREAIQLISWRTRPVYNSSATSVPVIDLELFKTYEFRIRLSNGAGDSPWSQITVIDMEIVPTKAPEEVMAEAESSTKLKVMWKPPPQDAQNGDLLGYKIYYWETDDPLQQKQMISVKGSVTETVLDNLKMYTEYSLLILAFNTAGDGPNITLAITQRTDEGIPGAPMNLRMIVTSLTSLNVTWEPPIKPNGKLLAYEVSFTQQMSAEGESRNVQVTISGQKHFYEVRELTGNVSYTFSVKAKTKVGWGPVTEGNISIAPQPGAPDSPERPWIVSTDSKTSFTIMWEDRDSGGSPIIGYIIQSKERGQSKWKTELISNDPQSFAVISYYNLKHKTEYQFRVIAINEHGISAPSLPTESVRSLTIAEEEDDKKFYRQWWFLVIVALTGVIFIILVVSLLCLTGRRRRRSKFKDATIPRTTVQPSMNGGATIIEDVEGGFSTFEMRRSQRQPSQRRASYRNSLPPSTSKSPPRPSPGSVNYSDEESKYAEDSSSLSEKPSELSSSDNESQESDSEPDEKLPPPPLPGPSSFNHTYVNGDVHSSWKRNNNPHNPYNAYSYTDSEQDSNYGVSLNGGHVIMNNIAGSRAPLPGFSSFV